LTNKTFRKPDLNAPRYRAKRLNILNADFYRAFRKDNPKFAHLTNDKIKSIIEGVNGRIWQTVINERDGVELPEQLGYIFIGSCPAKKVNKDYKTSKELQQLIQHRNWESDSYLAKIFYTNYGTKYRFQFSKLWGFKAVRQFSRSVGQVYPDQYLKYLVVENKKNIYEIFKKKSYKMDMEKIENDMLETYNEFDLD
jgi:hypothetical protein